MRHFDSLDDLKACLGQEFATSEWFAIDQQRIDLFAEATGDHQWIHVDPERAAKGPYGSTVAHGFLTLSMLGVFSPSAFQVGDVKMGVNYGLNKVRFPAPVKVGSQVRARYTLESMEPLEPMGQLRGYQFVILVTVDVAGGAKPACVAEYVSRRYH